MSGYQRFIAYVYEYRKGKKGGNCGFLKVEVKNQRCRIELHLHCVGIPPQVECRMYGFLRKDGLMNGILLGSCRTEADTVECLIETEASNMVNSGIPFSKLGGIVLLTEPGGFFGTEWDDQPVRPDNFRELRLPMQPEETVTAENKRSTQEPAPAANTTNPSEDISKEAAEPASTMTIESISEESISSEIIDNEIIPEKASENIAYAEDSSSDTLIENLAEKTIPATDIEPLTKESYSDVTVENTSANKNSSPSTTAVNETQVDLSEAPTSESTSTDSIHSTETPKPNPPFRFPVEEFSPFDDVEFVKCWKIQPADLTRCASRVRTLRNNRFLQYGYYNFGHLLLAQRPGGRFILGVPGGYDQQERFMANMFGFPYFKECRAIELPRNRGGYWYRLIDTPNFR